LLDVVGGGIDIEIALAVVLFLLITAGEAVEVPESKNNDRSCPCSNAPLVNSGTDTVNPDDKNDIAVDSKNPFAIKLVSNSMNTPDLNVPSVPSKLLL
jgi:hypothetical protein